MTDALTGPFAQVLEAQRERFNTKFIQAKRERPRLDGEAFKDVLRIDVAPVVEAVHRLAPEKSAEATDALYDLALDLLGQDLLGPGSRYPHVVNGWGKLLPGLARFVAQAPRTVAAAITNALYNLSSTPGARPSEWAGMMLALAEVAPDTVSLLKAGQVAAWRAGMAHFRQGALAVAQTLPPPVVYLALGLPSAASPTAGLLDRLAADPWFVPALEGEPGSDHALRLVARVGGFRGFGGVFVQPPRVTLWGEQIHVHDAGQSWLLAADAFGATFHRVERQSPTDSLVRYTLKPDGALQVGAQKRQFPELAGATSHAANPTTLAVTTGLSHMVFLVAVAGA